MMVNLCGSTKVRMTKEQDRLAREAWEALRVAFERHFEATASASQASGISPVMGYFLRALVSLPPGPMTQLADHLRVDAAWVTSVVDRLEARGDVVRVPSAIDRRVKILEVTDAGRATWRRLQRLVTTPPRGMDQLPTVDLLTLVRVGHHLSTVAGATPLPARSRRPLNPPPATRAPTKRI